MIYLKHKLPSIHANRSNPTRCPARSAACRRVPFCQNSLIIMLSNLGASLTSFRLRIKLRRDTLTKWVVEIFMPTQSSEEPQPKR